MNAPWIWKRPGWPKFTWNEPRVLAALAVARKNQGQLLGAVRMLDPTLSTEAMAQVLVEEAVKTSAIEGETLDPNPLRSSVARRLGLPTAGLPPAARHVDGLVQSLLDATQGHDRPLTAERLFGWQAALFPEGYSGIHRIRTGALRGREPMRVVSGPVGRERIHFEAPPRTELERELDAFLTWFNARADGMDGLVRAGVAHLWFVTVHPFEDGNGRLARAITDMALAQDENQPRRFYSLSAQLMAQRAQYYDVLEHTQRGDLNVTDWLVFFLEQVANACVAADDVVAATFAKARFWLANAGVELNERQRKVLNRLLDAGPDGFEGGMTNRKYTSLAKTSRQTASRELADLVIKGCLVSLNAGGRSSAYRIPWERLQGPSLD
jgi:Fic family protein